MTTKIAPLSTDIELGNTIIEKKYAKLWKQHHTEHVWIGMVNKRKVQIQSRFATAVTMFAFIVMVLTIILDSVVPLYSGLHHVAAVFNFYLVLLIWSATLPKCNPWQLKPVCLITIIPHFTDNLIAITNGGYNYHTPIGWCIAISTVVLPPPLLYLLAKNMSFSLQRTRNLEELIELASKTTSKIIGSAPIVWYIISGMLNCTFANPIHQNNVCELLINTTDTTAGAWWNINGQQTSKLVATGKWENCIALNVDTPDQLLTPHDIVLDTAIIRLNKNNLLMYCKHFQGMEVIFLFLTSAVFSLVRHKTTNDILAMRVNIHEALLIFFTILRLMLGGYLNDVSLNNFSIEQVHLRINIVNPCWYVLASVSMALMVHLVIISVRAHKKIQNEVVNHLIRNGSVTTKRRLTGAAVSEWK